MRPPNRTPDCLDILSSSDAEQVFNLRSQSYKRNFGEHVNTDALKWNSWDDRFINLGVFQDSELVSVLRLAYVTDESTFKKIMLCDFNPLEFCWPVVILSRAATRADRESQKLHSFLRLHGLLLAQKLKAPWVLGTLKTDSYRVPQMRRLGYDLILNPKPWDQFLKSQAPTFVAKLNMQLSGHFAISELLKMTESLQLKYKVVYSAEETLLKFKDKNLHQSNRNLFVESISKDFN